ncbi:patatin-like phospholipase family protein [Cystobacter fuscus]
MAAYAAAGLSEDAIEELMLQQTRESFWDPDPIGAVFNALPREGHGATGLLKGERFRKLLERTLPVSTFEELPHPLLLTSANLTQGTHEVFTSGELAPRVHATCAYPGLFRAVRVGRDLYWDGGPVDKAPALSLRESALGKELDAILVHYLPSRTRKMLGGPMAYAQGIAAGSAALRRDHFRLQLALLAERAFRLRDGVQPAARVPHADGARLRCAAPGETERRAGLRPAAHSLRGGLRRGPRRPALSARSAGGPP